MEHGIWSSEYSFHLNNLATNQINAYARLSLVSARLSAMQHRVSSVAAARSKAAMALIERFMIQ